MRQYFHSIAGMLVFLLGNCSAQASTVVYEDFQVASGNTVPTTPLELTQTGADKIELVDFEFLTAFDILSSAITQVFVSLGIGFDTGSFTSSVLTPETLLAHLAAIQKASEKGTYAYQIKAIPIPPAAVLPFAGLIGLVIVGRRDNGLKTA